MAIHIGGKIEQIAREKRFSASELARQIKTSPQNMRTIFQRESMDTGLLLTISKALDHNFFRYYMREFGGQPYPIPKKKSYPMQLEEPLATYKTKNPQIERLQEKIEHLQRENDLLREIHELYKIIQEGEETA